MYPDVEAVFVDTGLEYPEIREFVKGFDNVTWLKPKTNFKQVIEKYGYPVISKEVSQCIYEVRQKPNGCRASKFNPESDYVKKYGDKFNLTKWTFLKDSDIPISHKCCHIMKKEPAKRFEKATGKKPMVATMTDESALRMAEWLRTGCNSYDSKRPMGKPMSFWAEQDVLNYILQYNLVIASCYGEIIEGDQLEGQQCLDGCMTNLTTSKCKRTGCMFCMFGVHLEKEPNRFQMMKETHPKQYDYCIREEYTYFKYIPYIGDDGELTCDEIEMTRKGLGLGKVLDYIGVKY